MSFIEILKFSWYLIINMHLAWHLLNYFQMDTFELCEIVMNFKYKNICLIKFCVYLLEKLHINEIKINTRIHETLAMTAKERGKG